MKLKVDYDRARKVIERLQKAFSNREGLLNVVDDLVENQIPDGVKTLSIEHASFLFFIICNDHGMKSTRLYSQAKNLFYKIPELFNSDKVIDEYSGPEDQRLIESTGIFLGTRYPKQTAKSWYINSKKLIDSFDGNPICLFKSCSDAKELLKKINSFRGYGPKTGGMLLRAIIGLGFNNPSGIENVLVPVDVHDTRISFFTKIIRIKNNNGNNNFQYHLYVKDIQKILLETCNSINLSWLDIDRALWLIGSKGCVKKDCYHCPINEFCEIGNQIIIPGNENNQLSSQRNIA